MRSWPAGLHGAAQGTRFKESGFLRGTALWGWRGHGRSWRKRRLKVYAVCSDRQAAVRPPFSLKRRGVTCRVGAVDIAGEEGLSNPVHVKTRRGLAWVVSTVRDALGVVPRGRVLSLLGGIAVILWLMTQEIRTTYLAAMGITVWERRACGGAASLCADAQSPGTMHGGGVPVGLEGLAAEVQSCTRCALHEGRTQTVFGAGPRYATWCFVGSGPGAEEEHQGAPFVGRAGQLLDAMLGALALAREEVFVGHAMKCRTPDGRDPTSDEAASCLPFLRAQLAWVAPRILVVLGLWAAQSLLGTDKGLEELRGQVHDYQGTPLVVTYHPDALLTRSADKAAAWTDLKLAREVLLR